MKKMGKTKGDKLRADLLFSELIRSRGACEYCGKTYNLQCAHIVSRRYIATRVDERNAMCLCAGCHMWFTNHPVEWGIFVIQYMGQPAYEALRLKAEAGAKVDWAAEVVRLKQRLTMGEHT